MSELKLTIELVPKGAWGNNLRERLSSKDWDALRHFCYKKANHHCEICEMESLDLQAHEVWEFDVNTKTQTLKDIVALCPACHGVKHIRNSERIGYGKHAKAHFLKINNCSELTFAKHYAESQFLFEERNNILRWKLNADIDRFGGKGIEIKDKEIPLIVNPYENVDWSNATAEKCFKTITHESKQNTNEPTNKIARESMNPNRGNQKYSRSEKAYLPPPKIYSVAVDNYDGTIEVDCDYTNKIQWLDDSKVIKTKYNAVGRFMTTISVENLSESAIEFALFGAGGTCYSQKFELRKAD